MHRAKLEARSRRTFEQERIPAAGEEEGHRHVRAGAIACGTPVLGPDAHRASPLVDTGELLAPAEQLLAGRSGRRERGLLCLLVDFAEATVRSPRSDAGGAAGDTVAWIEPGGQA